MELYVTRHGQTEWNAQYKVCGLTDVDLTEVGIEQAKCMAREASDLPITRILCSPLLRARRTAAFVSKELGIPFASDIRLIEQNYGCFEGADRRDEAFLNNKKQLACRYPGGESAMQLAFRVYSLLEELRLQSPMETFLLVAHNGICRVIHTYFYDLTNDEYFRFSLDNCELRRYEYSNLSDSYTKS